MALTGSRIRETMRVVRSGGSRELAQRLARAAYLRLGASRLDFPLDLNNIADSRRLCLAVPSQRPARGTRLTVGWVCTPPSAGSGGHTTLFRMVEAVEAAGHSCVLYLYDRFGGELSRHERVIRTCWPRMQAEVRSVAAGFESLDAYVASGWQTAHVLAAHADLPTRRLYFVQDYEPFFFPHGSEYVLAEDTYRFGFRCITVGWMVAKLLHEQFNVDARVAEHGCDTSVYRLTNPGQRNGVVFYAKPTVARRGFELGVLALQEFYRRHPENKIHIFGDPTATTPFPAINHGRLTPSQLNILYNQCRTGIALSFTNVSLVPAEMLASGVIPVISGVRHEIADLDNQFVHWAEPSPIELAKQLSAIVENPEPQPTEVAASMVTAGWSAGQRVTVETIEDEVYGPKAS